jgi:hypothetical protein
VCGIVVDMTSQKVPGAKDIKAAAQAAAETAQAVASGAMRIPPASIQLASQPPELAPTGTTCRDGQRRIHSGVVDPRRLHSGAAGHSRDGRSNKKAALEESVRAAGFVTASPLGSRL